MRVRPVQRWALAALAWVVGPSLAGASPEFPRVVQETLSLSYHPACTLCHGLGQTGFGTVTTTFGTAMLNHGAIAGNDDSVRSALQQLQAQGSPLISDLIAGRDPNRGDLSHGCSSHPPLSSPSNGLVACLVALLLWLALRTRTSARRW